MLGNEALLQADRLAAGAAEPGRVPVVDDFVIRPGHQREPMLWRAGVLRDEHLHVVPVGKIHAAGEAPQAVGDDPAVDLADLAPFGGKRRGDEGVAAVAPHLFLRLRVVGAKDQVLDGQVGKDPAARAAAAPQFGGQIDHDRQVQLAPAKALGLVDAIKTRRDERFMRSAGDAPILLGLDCPFAQRGNQRAGLIDQHLALFRICSMHSRLAHFVSLICRRTKNTRSLRPRHRTMFPSTT